MAEFHEIGSSQFTDVTPTGTEQIQISATQKTTLQKIANLFKGKADPNNLVITDFNDSAPFSDGTKNTKVKFFVANADTVVNGPSNTGITSGNYYGIAIADGLMPTTGRVEYLLWVQGKKTLFRGYKVYISGKVSAGSGWEEVSGGGSLSDLVISSWSDIISYEDVQDPYIQNGDTLVDALRKLQWMTGNNTIKTFGDYSGIGMMWWDGDTVRNSFHAFYLEIETFTWFILFEGQFSSMGENATNEDIINYIVSNGTSIYLTNNYQEPVEYSTKSSSTLDIIGGQSVWYTGTKNPTITVNGSWFNERRPTAFFGCPYNIAPTFTTPSSNTNLHLHKNFTDVKPTSGYRAYTLYCQKVSGTYHIFINVAPYS